ncbi:MAG: DUF2339 domain-containing protein [Piscinibacter sp.]|uniref:DUF2339 domain-containing protein n=1 Tax=Piscinibacter sp. TaxID=1903157 RepID=UPI00258256A0|nr:DUF2339 domain-containing protein [Piscinibacter sp.]MCW5665400.1 DUF2339 domain-containing protein [Piscinibacter sp.]
MHVILAVLLGAIGGALAGENEFGAAVGAVLGGLIHRALRQQREIAALQQALKALPAAAPAIKAPAPEPEPAAEPVPPAAEVSVERPPAVAPEPLPDVGPGAVPDAVPDRVPAAAPLPPPAPAAPAAPGLVTTLRDWFFGGNTIVKAGVGILFIGLAFLAKYASEHVQWPIELRLAAVGAAALVLLVLGWRLRQRRPGYAQALQGGAVAVLYLTLFVAFRSYGVLGAVPVFALMVVVAALAAALAVQQDALALAVIGALGGFATPLLVSTGSGNHVALFAYYLVLDLGIAAVAWFRTWRVLNLVGFVFTFLVGSAWGVLQYRAEHYASAQAFLIAFFLLFAAILLLPARRAAEVAASSRWVHGTLLFGLPTVVFALQYGLVRDMAYGPALSALAMAAFYVALAVALRGRAPLALVFEGSLAIGTVLLTLVIPFALDARSTAGAWALEGAGLVWLGYRQARRLARAFGAVLLLLAGFALLHAIDRHPSPDTWANALLFNGVMLALAALAGALFVHRHAAPDGPERWAEPLLIGWALLAWATTAVLHVEALVEADTRLAALVGAAALVALVHALLGRRFGWRTVTLPLIGYLPLLGLALLASVLFQDGPFEHGGAWAWPAALAVQAFVLASALPRWAPAAQHLVHVFGVLLVAGLGAQQGRALTADWGESGSAWPWLGWLAVPALLLIVLPRPGTARRWPAALLPAAYQRSAAGVLAGVGVLWTLLANLVSDGSARPLPYLPLLSPLDLAIGVALVAAWAWARSVAWPAAPTAGVLGGAGFVWLNAMLLRSFHHWGGVPLEVAAWSAAPAVQTGLTLLWTSTALALMWGAARRALRVPWIVGAVLLGVVVLKLLLVDLSDSGTVTRIVSFIGVGVLMLVIGYVAPLPAAREKAHAPS